MSLSNLVKQRRILVCVGSGGVGKTTIAAALALAGVRAGRRTMVLTIDPAKRLANALGLDALDHVERRILDEKIALPGEPPPGEFYAMMLDQKRAFDEMVERRADVELGERLMRNRIYQQVSTRLAGSHEYAALAKLYEMCCLREEEKRYDFIVLDTPPTANTMDFLEAPGKLMNAIDSPALDWFVRLPLAERIFSRRAVGFWGASILKRLAKFVGLRFLEDMAAFLHEFQAVISEFRSCADHVSALLRRPEVAFIIVCSPSTASIDEALYLHERLRESGMAIGSLVINRVHPRGPLGPSAAELAASLQGRPALRGFPPDDLQRASEDLARTYREFQALAEIDHQRIERLRQATNAPCVEIPLFEQDISDMDGLNLMARHLLA